MLLSDDGVESCDDASRFDEQRDAAFYAAIVRDSDLESVSRPVVISRAMVLTEGKRRKLEVSAFSARRRRPAHSETTRQHPRSPWLFRRRQSSGPL